MASERPARTTPQGEATQERILQAAAEAFASNGYANTTLDEIAAKVGITKGAVLRHFKSKDQLFVETYKYVMADLTGWMDVPQELLNQGFFAVLEHWLETSAERSKESLPLRLFFLGKDGSHSTQHAVNKYLRSEDPDRTMEFVDFGIERGEISSDLDPLLIAAILEWVIEGYQQAAFTEEFDRSGLFRREASGAYSSVAGEVIEMLRRMLSP